MQTRTKKVALEALERPALTVLLILAVVGDGCHVPTDETKPGYGKRYQKIFAKFFFLALMFLL
jgi:hypothetical protein